MIKEVASSPVTIAQTWDLPPRCGENRVGEQVATKPGLVVRHPEPIAAYALTVISPERSFTQESMNCWPSVVISTAPFAIGWIAS
jgi:hypothetical protein